MYGSRESVNRVKMVTNTGIKVPVKKTFSDNLGRSPREKRKYPITVENSILSRNGLARINSLKEYREHRYLKRIENILRLNPWLFQPQFSMF